MFIENEEKVQAFLDDVRTLAKFKRLSVKAVCKAHGVSSITAVSTALINSGICKRNGKNTKKPDWTWTAGEPESAVNAFKEHYSAFLREKNKKYRKPELAFKKQEIEPRLARIERKLDRIIADFGVSA